jgi:hypothetical protein
MQLADLDEAGDFVFTFAVVHELPSAASYFSEATRTMKHGADLLLAEPAGHAHQTGVDGSELARTLRRSSIGRRSHVFGLFARFT